MNEKYYNLVFVKHENNDKNFLFKLPLNINLNNREKVFVDTSKGRAIGECVSDSFIVDNYTTVQIMEGTRAYYPLKDVVGYAKKQEGYRCIDFALADVPF